MDLEVDGLRLHWREEGRGPTVVLVHGSPVSSASFRQTVARLAPTHRVLAPDLPGFGRSDKPLHGLALPALAAILGGWLDRVAGEQYALLGQGSGALVALAAARPERVRALILANATLRPDRRLPVARRWLGAPFVGEALVGAADAAGCLLPGVARDLGVTAEYRRALASRGTRRTVLALERGEGWDEIAPRALACATLPRPTLLLWGDPDPYLPRGEVERLRRALPGSGLARLPGGGHFPQEDAAEAFAEALLSFLGRLLVS